MLVFTFGPYKNLILQTLLSLTLTLILTFLNIPIRFLEGLHTYIHPENLSKDTTKSFRPAIRRPENNPESEQPQPKKKHRSKEKFEFDENNAQIFRLQLVDGHLRSRVYFSEYRDCFVYCFVAISSLVLHCFLPVTVSEELGVWGNGVVIPVVLGIIVVLKLVFVIGKMSFERSASKGSEKKLSVLMGFVGFIVAGFIVVVIAPLVLDFEFDSVDGFGKVLICICAGCLTGFLFMPALHNARSFWLGTDQLRWSLSIVSCGWFGRMILYVNYVVVVFTSLLWVNPVTKMFVNRSPDGDMGVSISDFKKFRVLCLLISGVLQFVALRPNLQMYLNEAVLSWYQRLHASKVPDLDFSRAKIFLHNYYVCLVVLQFFAPPALILIFLGLSRIEGNFLTTIPFLSSFLKEVALFMAWWVVFIWAMISSSSLVLYRLSILYVS
ncbi:hypothetical protein GIB67_031177 [Kingdonia uniflora]|uniref:Transmembrane protein 161B n=1 Tax=Kingdonia uniflora TaxID=39325 RepID=A0A7J7NKV5_9MAGN|nr:hypothetical protein GIB67_031177 [Kingdonia uniflora]